MTWISSALQSFTQIFRWWVVVAPWEQGLRVRAGKRAVPLGAGIHFRIPFLDRVILVCTRQRVVKAQNQTVATLDAKVVTITLAVRYAIKDFEKVMASVATPERTLLNVAQGVAAEFITRTSSSDLTLSLLESSIAEGVGKHVEGWGLGSIGVHVIGFAYVKAYRFLTHDYEQLSGMDEGLTGDERRRTMME